MQWFWALVPFAILLFIDFVLMGIPAVQAIINMEDTQTKADMVLKVTGMQWKWQYEYPESGIKFISTLSTPRDQIANAEAKGEHYLLEVDKPVVLPVGKKVRILLTVDRRHPYLVGAAIRRQARCHSRFPARNLGADRKARHLSRPVRRTVRQGPRLHAGGRPCRAGARIRSPGWKEEGRSRGCRRRGRPDLEQGRTDGQGQGGLRKAPAPPVTSPKGKGLPPAFPALAGSKIVNGPLLDMPDGKVIKDSHVDRVLNGKAGTAMQAFKHHACPMSSWQPSSPTSATASATRGRHDPARPDQVPALGDER
jgi:cytochrome c oxidase subunit 2